MWTTSLCVSRNKKKDCLRISVGNLFWRRWRDVEPVLRPVATLPGFPPAQNLGKGCRLFESCIPLIFTKIKRNAARAFLFILAEMERCISPLAVPEMRYPRSRSPHFDRCANPRSLYPPPAALAGVACVARNARVHFTIRQKRTHHLAVVRSLLAEMERFELSRCC